MAFPTTIHLHATRYLLLHLQTIAFPLLYHCCYAAQTKAQYLDIQWKVETNNDFLYSAEVLNTRLHNP